MFFKIKTLKILDKDSVLPVPQLPLPQFGTTVGKVCLHTWKAKTPRPSHPEAQLGLGVCFRGGKGK